MNDSINGIALKIALAILTFLFALSARADLLLSYQSTPIRIEAGQPLPGLGQITFSLRLALDDLPLGTTIISTSGSRIEGENRANLVDARISDGAREFFFGRDFITIKIYNLIAEKRLRIIFSAQSCSTGRGSPPIVIAGCNVERRFGDNRIEAIGDTATPNELTVYKDGIPSEAITTLGALVPNKARFLASAAGQGTLKMSTVKPPSTCPVEGESQFNLVNFSPNDPRYHCYHVEDFRICAWSEAGCSISNVVKAFLIYPAPRVDFSFPVNRPHGFEELQGVATIIDAVGFSLPLWLNDYVYGNNFISYDVSSDGTEVLNTTYPDHVFYPGWIDRKVLPKSDGIYIATTGSGIGEFKDANVELGRDFLFPALNIMILRFWKANYSAEEGK
jgi:hypothetical protein